MARLTKTGKVTKGHVRQFHNKYLDSLERLADLKAEVPRNNSAIAHCASTLAVRENDYEIVKSAWVKRTTIESVMSEGKAAS